MKKLIVILAMGWAGGAYAADSNNGARLYTTHCGGCHGDKGVMAGMPNFQRSEGLFRPDGELLARIKQGTGVMPAFNGLLSDRDIFDIIAHLRTLSVAR